MLDHLGMIEIEPGERGGNRFRLSTRWRGIDGVKGGEADGAGAGGPDVRR
jgi:hypothetical protein